MYDTLDVQYVYETSQDKGSADKTDMLTSGMIKGG